MCIVYRQAFREGVRMRINMGFLGRVAAVLLLGFVGSAAAITSEQMQMFQQLDPTTQQSLLSKFGRGSTAGGTTQIAPESPELVLPRDAAAAGLTTATDELRLRGGSSLVIRIEQTPPLPPPLPDQPASGTQQPAASTATPAMPARGQQTTTVQTLTAVPATEDPAAELKPLPSQVSKLIGAHYYRLDKDGVLDLPGVARIPLAGLMPEEAVKRLGAEPLLRELYIEVTLLPLQPIGSAALQPFGYDLFAGVPTTFAPATDIPVPSNYVIGPGDTVQVQLFGKENLQYVLVVSRDGTLNFPNIGPISVAGQSFDKMQKNLSERIANQMIGMQASITMGPLRSIRVFVLGDAARPGSYTVSGLSTITNALFVSGGVKTNGSLRDIQLKRGGKVIARLDLYDLLLRGDTSQDARLQPGDAIFVPPVGNTIAVSGEVKRPAIYELRGEKTVADVITLAGGVTPAAASDLLQLERIESSGQRSLVEINLKNAAQARMQPRDGDTLHVRSVLDRYTGFVRLSGHVQRPGDYQWREGMRLADVISTLELLSPRPDLEYVLIKRELPPDLRLEMLSARLGRAIAHPDSDDNILLQARDEIIVFGLGDNRADLLKPVIDQLRLQARADNPERIVSVLGNVMYPGDYPLEGGMKVGDLIRAAGGFNQQAYTLGAEIIRYEVMDGSLREIKRLPIDLAAVDRGVIDQDVTLRPFDVLNVQQVPSWEERQTVEVKGEVRFPGQYVMRRGETLTQLIERAGGLNERAFPRGAVFLRENLRIKEQAQLDSLRDRLKADLAAASLTAMQEGPQAQQAVATAQGLLTMLESTQAAGRLVIDLPAVLKGDTQLDVVLKDGDRLFIPDAPQEVTIIGEVNYPTSHIYQSSLSQSGYIRRSGGLTYKADDDRIYVIKANGEVVTGMSTSWFTDIGQQDIEPGDTIVVPLDAERLRPLTLWSSVAQIVYHIALSFVAFDRVMQ